MFVPTAKTSAIYKKDNSIFIAQLGLYCDFELDLENLKNEHKKAAHFVRATRFINEFSQIIEQSSDDGEPKGSSGMPALNVLRGEQMINCALIIVRYFGGKKLGIGGLVRAYTNAALEAINEAKNSQNLILFLEQKIYEFSIKINAFSRAQYILKTRQIELVKSIFESKKIKIKIKTDSNNLKDFIESGKKYGIFI